jgi:cell division septation protein DedD
MTEPPDTERHEDATLRRAAALRQMWQAQEQARRNEAVPPPPAPDRRAGVVTLLLSTPVLAAVAVLSYFAYIFWPRPSEAPHPLPPSAQVRTVAPPGAAATVPHSPQGSAPTPAAGPTPAAAASARPRPSLPRHATPAAPRPGGAGHHVAVAVLAERPTAYHVQVGAFNVLAYAQDLMRELRARDYSVTLVEAPKRPTHRVWIDGAFDQVAAERLINRLRRDGFDAFLVRE